MSYPKNGKWKSLKYRKWISEQPCLRGCDTGQPSDPHHEDHGFNNSGTAMKPPDTQIVPLCFNCHRIERANTGPEEFWEGIDYKKAMVNFLTRYLIERNFK
jgi:hypothetical protein